MKKPINEIAKLQRLAGLITESEYQESMIEATKNLTINQVVKELNKIANSKGFYAVDKSADVKSKKGESGVNNLVKWKDDNDNVVELYYNNPYGPDVTVDDLEIHFESDTMDGEDPAKEWLNPTRWDEAFGDEEPTELNENLSSEEFKRMDDRVNQNHILSLLAAAEGIMGDLENDGFDAEKIHAYINQIIVNDI